MTVKARTMLELKEKLRKEMGWKARRSWTEQERTQIKERYRLSINHRAGVYTATEKGREHADSQR